MPKGKKHFIGAKRGLMPAANNEYALSLISQLFKSRQYSEKQITRLLRKRGYYAPPGVLYKIRFRIGRPKLARHKRYVDPDKIRVIDVLVKSRKYSLPEMMQLLQKRKIFVSRTVVRKRMLLFEQRLPLKPEVAVPPEVRQKTSAAEKGKPGERKPKIKRRAAKKVVSLPPKSESPFDFFKKLPLDEKLERIRALNDARLELLESISEHKDPNAIEIEGKKLREIESMLGQLFKFIPRKHLKEFGQNSAGAK